MSITAIPVNVAAAARAASLTVRPAIVAGTTTMTEGEEGALVALANAAMAAGFDPLGAMHDAVSCDASRNPVAERHRIAV
jgi:hypothetical protein